MTLCGVCIVSSPSPLFAKGLQVLESERHASKDEDLLLVQETFLFS